MLANYFAGEPANRSGILVAVMNLDNVALTDVLIGVDNRITSVR
jgi:hypothetical protein